MSLRGRPKGATDSRPRQRSSRPATAASTLVRDLFRVMAARPQIDIAVALDRSRVSIANYKRGKTTPSILLAEEFANALGYRIVLQPLSVSSDDG